MKLRQLVNEDAAAGRKKRELAYNLMHRASPETIRAVAAVVDVAEDEPQSAAVDKPPVAEDEQTFFGQADDWLQRYVRDPAVRYGVMSPGNAGWKDGKSPVERPGEPPSDFDPVQSGYGMLSKGYGMLRSGLGKLGRWEYDTLSSLAPGLFPPESPKVQQAPNAQKAAKPSEPTFKQKSDELISSTEKLIQYTKARQALDRQATSALTSGDRQGYERYKDLIQTLDAAYNSSKGTTTGAAIPSIPADTGVARSATPVGSMPAAPRQAAGTYTEPYEPKRQAAGTYTEPYEPKRQAAGTYTEPYEPKRQAAGTYTEPYDQTVVKSGDTIWNLFAKKYGRSPTSKELANLARLNKVRNWKRLKPGSRIAWTENLNEATFASKQALVQHILSLDENDPKQSAEIDKLETFAMRHVIRDVVARTLKAKALPATLTRTVSSWFIDGEGTYEERLKFIEQMPVIGYLETSELMTTELNNFNNIRKYESRVYDSVKDSFMQYEGSIGGVGIGKGELYCIFFALGVKKGAPGDLSIDGKEAEVKSVKARFLATTGYGSTVSFFPKYRKMLQDLVPKLQLPTDPNWFNWNYKGLHELSDLFVRSGKPNQCKDVIDKTLESLYVESTPSQRSRVVDTISNDGSFDASSFLNAWLLMQFEYYKSIDGFDGILFINPNNFNFIYIEDSLQLDDNNGLFRIAPSLSWKESRNITSQVTLL